MERAIKIELNWSNLTLDEINRMLYASTEEEAAMLLRQLAGDTRKGVRQLVTQYQKRLDREQAERERLRQLWQYERELAQAGYRFIGGIDEAGRGPLAGPVVAACVILPLETELVGLNDSKQVSAKERAVLAEVIKEKAVAWSVGVCDHQEIDRINILQATKKAMLDAVEKLSHPPDYLLIDALELSCAIPQQAVIHGDALSASIAAASIIAKTYRDGLMEMMDVLYPAYGFKEHKGYGTSRHLEALLEFGPCPIHRHT
ncbi:MAG: ribonuclease HII, partial [Clostridia bacterium]|nr:ribonuclease HII [Clostridia bacterium]